MSNEVDPKKQKYLESYEKLIRALPSEELEDVLNAIRSDESTDRIKIVVNRLLDVDPEWVPPQWVDELNLGLYDYENEDEGHEEKVPDDDGGEGHDESLDEIPPKKSGSGRTIAFIIFIILNFIIPHAFKVGHPTMAPVYAGGATFLLLYLFERFRKKAVDMGVGMFLLLNGCVSLKCGVYLGILYHITGVVGIILSLLMALCGLTAILSICGQSVKKYHSQKFFFIGMAFGFEVLGWVINFMLSQVF